MPSLTVMTFNVQLMMRLMSKGKFDLGELFSDPFSDRLSKLERALTTNPLADVLILNEVFSEEARSRLRKILAPHYPHIKDSFGPTGLLSLVWGQLKLEDSGLMLCSKYKFQHLAFKGFGSSAGADAVALKGVGVVKISAVPRDIVLALTHLQAEQGNGAIRSDQIKEIRTALANQLGSTLQRHHIVLAGDLNIIGNPPSRSEWNTVFHVDAQLFKGVFKDCWEEHMPVEDYGYTRTADQSGLATRLDYILLNDRTTERMVAQHMRVRHRGVSDHFAVWADINIESPHCTPATATPVTPSAPDWCGYEKMSFKYSGSMQWARFDKPGTYIFNSDPSHTLRIFEAHNISDPLPDFDRMRVDLRKIPGTNSVWHDGGLPPTGRKFHIPNAPFFVRLTHPGDLTGSTGFGWKLCRGRSPFDAIVLPSHDPLTYSWPTNAPLDEEAWFVVYISKSVDGRSHTSTFIVDNPSSDQINVRIRQNDPGQPVLKKSGWSSSKQVSVTFGDTGGRSYFLTVERKSATTKTIQVQWRTELSFLMGAREISGSNTHKLGLFCVDETGIDWLGSDETVMKLSAHGKQIRKFPVDRAYWDADTDDIEYFSMCEIPYINGLVVEVRELEKVLADDVGKIEIVPLAQADKGDDPNSKTTLRRLKLGVGSGEYELLYCLGRNPVGSSPTGVP